MREDIITLDGPTSSGKNSVGFLLGKKLGYQYIDSGMIYRAGCLKMIQQSVAPDDLEKIIEIYKNLNVKFESNDRWKMFLESEDVTDKLHISKISKLVPIVAAKKQVREVIKAFQKNLGRNGKLVVGGRDIGSEIFPEARYKFFLTASVEERAKRRFKQLLQKDPSIKYPDVLKDMIARDKHDSEREASPMRIPQDAVVIDNTKLSVEETVSEMLKHIQNYA